MHLRPRFWGALLGALLFVAWLIWGPRFFWIAVPAAVGYALGWALESRHGLLGKLREIVRVMGR